MQIIKLNLKKNVSVDDLVIVYYVNQTYFWFPTKLLATLIKFPNH